MTCYHPLQAFQSPRDGLNKRKIIFVKTGQPITRGYQPIKLPCGQCIGCRISRSREWSLRILNEAQLHPQNSFITLTYEDEKLPWDHSLNKAHFQKFIKRLRKSLYPKKIKFYHCGEYGEPTPENDFIARPHYHAILFNHDFDDKVLFKETEGINTYSSDTLDSIWKQGFTTVGDVTFQSAAYIARYCMKKINGAKADEHYTRTDFTTGEIINLQPEYSTMSNRPGGIGKEWFKKYHKDMYPSDNYHYKGKELKPPKYYDRLYEVFAPESYQEIKERRMVQMEKYKHDTTPARLRDREIVKKAQIGQLKRNL